jgi:hypothetical protein
MIIGSGASGKFSDAEYVPGARLRPKVRSGRSHYLRCYPEFDRNLKGMEGDPPSIVSMLIASIARPAF